jgi:pimeloyl-ACP methyl ester carboxylesterase
LTAVIDAADCRHGYKVIQGVFLIKKAMSDNYRQSLIIPAGKTMIQAELRLPTGASGIIIFSQTGSSEEHQSRSRVVATHLEAAGLGTLIPGMFTPQERSEHGVTYDLELLTHRLVLLTEWLLDRDLFGHYRLGYYGTGVGAAAALKAAASLGTSVGAIVCRGARSDLVMESLPYVEAPTLLIAGESDRSILDFNREALDRLPGDRRLAIIGGVAHNFSEPAKMQEAAALTSGWFLQHLKPLPRVQQTYPLGV